MFDRRLRPLGHRLLAPVAQRLPAVGATAVTLVGGAVGLAAAVVVALGHPVVATALWLANRVLDGLDGVLARRDGSADDAGGYLDMLVDVVVYAAIPLGVAAGIGTTAAWTACAFLLASFSINTISWSYLSALLEKRGQGARVVGEATAITMPPGLVEGTETILFYVVLLAWPGAAVVTMAVMAALVVAGATMRAAVGWRHLGTQA